MRFRFSSLALILCLASSLPALAQNQVPDRAAEIQTAFTRARHLQRGINVSHWFSQSANDYSAHHTETWTDDGDIALIARMGFDNVRLSIDPTPLEQPPLDSEGLNADFTGRLDHALDTMLADGLAVQVDIHPEEPYKLEMRTSNAAVDRFVSLWRKLAAHYANRDPNRVFFEIMNEPEQNDPYRWAGIQARAAAAIRAVAPRNTIIATGPNYSDIVDLLAMHPLPDGNVIYNFHFYDPHTFTHQGATWGQTWWRFEHGIPYPATEDSMHSLLNEVPDPAYRFELENYWLDHWDAHRIRLLIDEAAAWGKANHVPLICNEFGAYRRVTEPASRNAWIHDVRTALEANNIGWAMWDYRGGFNVVDKQDGHPAKPAPATVEALGLHEK
jgi:aryl-phospho-beta-D-glucosidase BglC (GH1 family)